MKLTHYHAKYYAHILTQNKPGNSVEKIAGTLSDAQVDINPHQIEAALFAFRSPFSKGVVMGDEVGLGKTIEACIVIAQKWAERKRKILIIVPANLKTQWQLELDEKFYIPSVILDSEAYKAYIKSGVKNPFEQENNIIIASYNFAYEKADALKAVAWDLVIMDEAHKVRNAYKTDNVIGRTLLDALNDKSKLLLTATPLHNSVMELYGLSRFIDDYIFGDVDSFKMQFSFLRDEDQRAYDDLIARTRKFCIRTLRRQVTEYIKYTERRLITQEFLPTPKEQEFYDLFSAYLQRDRLWALPQSGRPLVSMVLWKLLASSSSAIAGTLQKLLARLETMYETGETVRNVKVKMLDEGVSVDSEEELPTVKRKKLTEAEMKSLKSEIDELTRYYGIAASITQNAKGEALLIALEKGFEKLKELKAPQKAVIFTESRRTQEYIARILQDSKYKNKFVLYFGGMPPKKQEQVKAEFKDKAQIMIATESAAEGLNLQFCPMVINYDLPFNPQRIEQRIGRCHRYGQKNDVVVINFLNQNNLADQRVYEILRYKFQLFEGVFGASDGILGDIDALDFEKRVVEIYQTCRTSEEIERSFAELRESLTPQIDERMDGIRKKLLENFDDVVAERLKMNYNNSSTYLDKYETILWELSKFYLGPFASFGDKSFFLNKNPFAKFWNTPAKFTPANTSYKFDKTAMKSQRYRLNHPIARRMIEDIQLNLYRDMPEDNVTFDLSGYEGKISALEPLKGKRGVMAVYDFSISSVDYENHILCIAVDSEGNVIPPDICEKLWSLGGKGGANINELEFLKEELKRKEISREDYDERRGRLRDYVSEQEKQILTAIYEQEKARLVDDISSRNTNFFGEEMDKLDKWAKDIKQSMEKSIKNLDGEIAELKKAIRHTAKLQDRLALEKQVKELEAKRNGQRYDLYSEQDKIDKKKDELINGTQKKLDQHIRDELLFTIKWEVV